MANDKVYWRPATKCCWHAFVVEGKILVSLCGNVHDDVGTLEKINRPPVFYRCSQCNQEEKAHRDRNLPVTIGWEEAIDV